MSIVSLHTSSPSQIEQEQILQILSGAFSSNRIAENVAHGFFTGYRSEYENFILLKKSDEVIGVALVAKRKINLLSSQVAALTIGPVAISTIHQGLGYSTALMQSIDKLALKSGTSIMYLQGIDGFYSKHKYFPCASKSKVILRARDCKDIKIVENTPLTISHVDAAAEMYLLHSAKNSCTSNRTKSDWGWLLNFATKTWTFYEPILVLSNGQPAGYFCSDPDSPGRIREAIHANVQGSTEALIGGLKKYCMQKSIEQIEVMTWRGSEIYSYAKKDCDAEFVEYFKKDGSQVMKIVNYFEIKRLLNKLLMPDIFIQDIQVFGDQVLIKIMHDEKSYHLNIEDRIFPGVLTGLFDATLIQNYAILPERALKKLFAVFKNLHKPFFYQGDNF